MKASLIVEQVIDELASNTKRAENRGEEPPASTWCPECEGQGRLFEVWVDAQGVLREHPVWCVAKRCPAITVYGREHVQTVLEMSDHAKGMTVKEGEGWHEFRKKFLEAWSQTAFIDKREDVMVLPVSRAWRLKVILRLIRRHRLDFRMDERRIDLRCIDDEVKDHPAEWLPTPVQVGQWAEGPSQAL